MQVAEGLFTLHPRSATVLLLEALTLMILSFTKNCCALIKRRNWHLSSVFSTAHQFTKAPTQNFHVRTKLGFVLNQNTFIKSNRTLFISIFFFV